MVYGRYVWYQDTKTGDVEKAGYFIRKYGIQPNKSKRFRKLGNWYDHEKTPFKKGKQAVRYRYGKLQKL